MIFGKHDFFLATKIMLGEVLMYFLPCPFANEMESAIKNRNSNIFCLSIFNSLTNKTNDYLLIFTQRQIHVNGLFYRFSQGQL